VTAANTDDEVTELLAALDRLADTVPFGSSREAATAVPDSSVEGRES
jgi:hypothetical protein